MDYGLTNQGFIRKRLDVIKAELETEYRTQFGQGINTAPESVFGQSIGLRAAREDQIWELAEAVYNAGTLSAEGTSLEQVMAILGISKLGQTKTIAQQVSLYGTPGSTIPALTKIKVAGNDQAVFETQSTVTLGTGQDQIQRIRFADLPTSGAFKIRFASRTTAAIPYNANAAFVQTALNGLDGFSGCFEVTGSVEDRRFDIKFVGLLGKTNNQKVQIADSTLNVNVAWFAYQQEGIPQGVTQAIATTFGPIAAPAYTLTDIVTPVTGLTRTANTIDAVTGRDVESDSALRLRSKSGQALLGRGTVEAMRVLLKEVEGVQEAIVFENDSNATNSDGLPPKSFRAYVQGGADQDIWDSIWLNKPAGIYPDGLVVGTTIDSQGLAKTVRFSRPEVVPLFFWITITKDSDFQDNGVAQIKTAIANYINSLQIGQDVVIYPKVVATLNDIPGIADMEILRDTDSNPMGGSDDRVIIGINQIARVVNPENDIMVTVV